MGRDDNEEGMQGDRKDLHDILLVLAMRSLGAAFLRWCSRRCCSWSGKCWPETQCECKRAWEGRGRSKKGVERCNVRVAARYNNSPVRRVLQKTRRSAMRSTASSALSAPSAMYPAASHQR